MARLFAAVLFGCGFGLAFVFVGARRVVQFRRERNPIEAVVWGLIGVLLGVAVVAGLTWFIVSAVGPSSRPSGPAVPYQ